MELQKAAEQPRSLRLGSGLPPHRPEGERGEAEGEPGLDGSRASPKKVVPENAHSISIGAIFNVIQFLSVLLIMDSVNTHTHVINNVINNVK